MFTQILPVMNPPAYKIYCEIFIDMCVNATMMNSVILSVNCLFISSVHRIKGHEFLAPFVESLAAIIKESHT